jgi:hypothetical protein
MASQLIELPTELVENIAYNLPLPEVQNLRLTCRSIRDQIAHPFKDRFFRRRHITLTTPSLESLIEVARHPQLGPALNHLFINATPIYEKQVTAIEKKIRDAHLDTGLRRLLETERDLLERRKSTVLDSFNNGADRKLLSLAFLIIGHLRSITFIYEGFDTMDPEDAMYHMRRCQNEMSRPFMTTMSAIAFSGLTVEAITATEDQRYGFVCIGKMKFMAWQYSNLRHAFANLKVLKLDLRDWMNPTRGWLLPGIEISPNVAQLLSLMPNLRDLDLSCHVYSSREEDVFTRVGTIVRLPHLERCTLGLVIAKEQSLLRLLNSARKTLKHLTLRNVVLVAGSWTSLLESLAKTLSLESLVLDNLYQDESIVVFKKDGQPVARFEGASLKESVVEYGRNYRLTSPISFFQYFWDDAMRTSASISV